MSPTEEQVAPTPSGIDVEQHETGALNSTEPSIIATELNQDDDPFLVNFGYDDPKDPRSFPTWYKLQILLVTMSLELWVNAISSIYSFGAPEVAAEFGVGQVAARVPAAVFLFGFGIGAVFAAPLSEEYGRVPVMIIGLVILALLQIGCALAQNLATLIVLRFIGGCFGAVGFNSIGTVADLWDSENQGWGVNTFALSAEVGATAGPIIGAFIVQNIGWRWTFGVAGIVLAFLLALFILTVPETRAGVILARRAKSLRNDHSEPRYHASHERIRSQREAKQLFKETVGRPLFMLFTEPIVFWFTLFDAANYSLVYIFIEIYPLIYIQWGFDTSQQGLALFGVLTGFVVAYGLYALQLKWYKFAGTKRPGGVSTPEDLLLWGIPGGFLFPVSLFFFAWTSFPPVPWIVSVLAGALFGVSSHTLFLIVSDYTVSSYAIYAASAVAAQSLLRELFCGAFTMIAEIMYHNVGYSWATSILAFIGVPLSVIPLIFYKFGPTIRKRSSFAKELQGIEEKERRRRAKLESRATTLTTSAADGNSKTG
ncbi:related to mfs-multidrug-resistance transporter [Melanopsichium pennsylvanicum]|uniref:Related to mfs-multidrug-resistance transporter n=2 Tax=Melanopsichium pennsylvanicum TaxID=63383 RepID=A0AAJ4XJU9_9BASI|nr:related to mfs-multidrug-resistance transporter [Melanopsichium pennsylvanicum 4]SNX82418.1 related to mfs-multidrug-resistance transporter [Melanopsichium pennsylvanicum]